MRNMRNRWLAGSVLVLGAALAAAGCLNTAPDASDYARGPAPLRTPSPAKEGDCGSYEDSLTGGHVFSMYCSYCHNAPSLAERPYSQFRNVASHMRVRANLTGKEYAKLMEFLRRWNDVPPPTPEPAPSPSRLIFSQPMSELRPEEPKPPAAPPTEQPKPPAAPPTEQPKPPPAPPKPPGDAAGQKPGPQP
jgi:hypothetical protein